MCVPSSCLFGHLRRGHKIVISFFFPREKHALVLPGVLLYSDSKVSVTQIDDHTPLDTFVLHPG